MRLALAFYLRWEITLLFSGVEPIEELSKLTSLHKGNQWLVGMPNNSDIDLNFKKSGTYFRELQYVKGPKRFAYKKKSCHNKINLKKLKAF